MAKKFCTPMVKRMSLSLILGALAGLLCAYFASTNSTDPNFWVSAVMWSIFFNRFVIGFVVALAGFIVVHPLLKIRMYPVCRGACVGFFVSLSLAFGAYSAGGENAMSIFWATIVSGMIYGLIIDLIVTKVAGEGEALLPGTQK